MQTIEVQLPDTVNIDAQEIQLLLAGKLFEKDCCQLGKLRKWQVSANAALWRY